MKAGSTFLPEYRQKALMECAISCSILEGNMAEFGVAYGGTVIKLAETFPNIKIYAFDTFEGFQNLPNEWFNASPHFSPTKYSRGYEWKQEWGADFDWNNIINNIQQYKNIDIRKGIFPETTKNLENEKYSFVHMDVDIYSSTKYGLEYFYNHLLPGGCIVIDDFYYHTRYPGVREAIEEYFQTGSQAIVKSKVEGQGIIFKS